MGEFTEVFQLVLRTTYDLIWILAQTVRPVHIFLAVGVIVGIISFYVYNSKPDNISFATWFLFVLGDTAEAGSFFVMTEAELMKNAIPIMFAVGSALTFVIAIRRRQVGWPSLGDLAVVSVDLLITFGWWKNRLNAAGANIMFVLTEFISFIPVCKDILIGKERPYIAPWLGWAVTDACFYAVVISLPHNKEEVVYPLLQMIAHLGVVACILIRRWSIEKRVPT